MAIPTCVSRDEVEWVEVREVIATVHLDGLQESHHHPEPDQHQVVAEQGHTDEEPSAKDCEIVGGGREGGREVREGGRGEGKRGEREEG